MGLFDWVNKSAAANADAKFPKTTQQHPPKPSASQKTASNVEPAVDSKLKQVLDTHHDCKAKLLKVLVGESDDTLDVDMVSGDQNCVLGKWIYKEGKAMFGTMPEYESVRAAHAEFHVYAGEALKQHLQGNKVFADVIVKTKFRNTSNKNQLMITSLFNAAKFR